VVGRLWVSLSLVNQTRSGKTREERSDLSSLSLSPPRSFPHLFLLLPSLNSAKLLTFLPINSQPLFSARATYDLVVVYDRDSTPTSPTATAVNTLVSIIYEREFTSATLKRAPVVMLGGFEAFVAEMKRPPGGGGGSPLIGSGGGGEGGGLPR